MPEPMPSLLELSRLQRKTLEVIVLKGTSIEGHAWREHIILLWAEGMSPSETARQLNVDEKTVKHLRQKWLSSTKHLGAAEEKVYVAMVDLISKVAQVLSSGQGRKKKRPSIDRVNSQKRKRLPEGAIEALSPAAKALIEIVHHKPRVYGINRSNWTLRSLAFAFEKQHGQSISATTVSRYMKEAGYSWRKSRKILTSPDPNYREKVELLLQTLHSLKADEDLFFIDELGPMQIKRYGGRCYSAHGKTPTHPQNPRSKGSITLCGALSATTNQVTWFYSRTKDSKGMIDLAEILFNQCHDKSHFFITWDAASWHRSNQLEEWVNNLNLRTTAEGAGPVIEFVPLPSSAQFLNVIEAVFSAMKRAVIHFSNYQSEEEMKDAISMHFRERNEFFRNNPRRAGNKIWEVDFFENYDNLWAGNYREW